MRDERAKLLRSIRIMKPEEVLANTVPGQYGPARSAEQMSRIPAGKRRGSGIADRHLRGRDVLCRQLALGGRAVLHPHREALPKRVTEIAIQFNSAPLAVFGGQRRTTPRRIC